MIGPYTWATVAAWLVIATPLVGLLVRARHHPPVILPLIRSTPAREWIQAAAALLVLGLFLAGLYAVLVIADALLA